MIKACGCKIKTKGGVAIKTLCSKHLGEIIREANKTYEKRGQPKLA